jgi:Domain of Unknown Function with PDB structure (DUF3857)
MKLNFVFAAFILFKFSFFAQETPIIKFGVVSPEELAMKIEPSDSSAEAVILYAKANIDITFDQKAEIVIDYHYRVKILKTSALERGSITIPYLAEKNYREYIDKIIANTYNDENGKLEVTPLNKKSIFDEGVGGELRQVKLILPNVKVGSVIEYKYQRITPFEVRNTPRDWYFQADVPTKWNELNVFLPREISYSLLSAGYLPFHITDRKEEKSVFNKMGTKFRYVVKDAPAFRNQSFITTKNDYISKLEFQLRAYYSEMKGGVIGISDTWTNIAKTLDEEDKFGGRLKSINFLKDIASQFTAIADTAERVDAIFKYMTENFKWDGDYGIIAYRDLKTVFDTKKGSAGELNLLLLALLKRSDVKANAAILSTRAHGEILKDYPKLNKFNYMLVHMKRNAKDFYLDATEQYAIPGLLAERCLNNQVCILEKDTGYILPLKANKSLSIRVINMNIDSITNAVSGSFTYVSSGNYALAKRSAIAADGEAVQLKNYKEKYENWEIADFKIENKDQANEQFKISFTFQDEPLLGTSSKFFISPLFAEGLKENPFKEKERLYPVDLSFPYENMIMTKITLPKNFKVVELPKNKILALPNQDGKFVFIVEQIDNVINIKSQLLVSKSVFEPKEYYSLREFYSAVLQKQMEQVILSKS